MNYQFVKFRNSQYVLSFQPELYNGVGGERIVENLKLDYMGPILKEARLEARLTQDDFLCLAWPFKHKKSDLVLCPGT